MKSGRAFLGMDAVVVASFFLAAVAGAALGLALALTRNADTLDAMVADPPALPSRVLDRNGELITTFFAEEQRELVSLSEVPAHLVEALLTREDKNFFRHRGWDVMALAKALVEHFLLGRPLRGASTITQQVAGTLFEDRTDISIGRKIRELWWAFQLERHWTKQEILERYLNQMYLGHGVYGVGAASRFYFGKAVSEISIAESALLVVIFANWSLYSPLIDPERARRRSHEILMEMVAAGYATLEGAEASFGSYWDHFAWNRSAESSAFYSREDRAPYFSAHVRGLLEQRLFGAWDIDRDGLTIRTTLDLGYQSVADDVMARNLDLVTRRVERSSDVAADLALELFLPLVETLGLSFDLPDLLAGDERRRNQAMDLYLEQLNPQLDAVATMLGIVGLKEPTLKGQELWISRMRSTQLEGALISLDSTRGWILAMVGGRKFESTNQLNRATQGHVQPGSSFKPLYYFAAIESRAATMATLLVDAPTSFVSPDGTYWEPLNYEGAWQGSALLWWALADSKNVPSVKVFDLVGMEAAIDWSSRLLGIDTPEARVRAFGSAPGYPIALGVAAVSPLQMARAYATFANGGRAVEPVAIVKVVDRDGRVILEAEREALVARGGVLELMSPQTARIVTEMLEAAVRRGTLRGARIRAINQGADMAYEWDRPVAGKTGTTQNWSAAWTVGFTPQVTTAIWMGFDRGSRSLGRHVTGATAVAPAWAEYMDAIHRGLEVIPFREPNGLVRQVVCSVSGLLATEICRDGTETLTFLEGTAPRTLCDIHPYREAQIQAVIERLEPLMDPAGDLPPEMLESLLGEGEGGAAPRSPLAP